MIFGSFNGINLYLKHPDLVKVPQLSRRFFCWLRSSLFEPTKRASVGASCVSLLQNNVGSFSPPQKLSVRLYAGTLPRLHLKSELSYITLLKYGNLYLIHVMSSRATGPCLPRDSMTL